MKLAKIRRAAVLSASAGMMFQFGSCSIPDITIPTTLSGEEALITVIRGAILTPIDAAITAAVRGAFTNDED